MGLNKATGHAQLERQVYGQSLVDKTSTSRRMRSCMPHHLCYAFGQLEPGRPCQPSHREEAEKHGFLKTGAKARLRQWQTASLDHHEPAHDGKT